MNRFLFFGLCSWPATEVAGFNLLVEIYEPRIYQLMDQSIGTLSGSKGNITMSKIYHSLVERTTPFHKKSLIFNCVLKIPR